MEATEARHVSMVAQQVVTQAASQSTGRNPWKKSREEGSQRLRPTSERQGAGTGGARTLVGAEAAVAGFSISTCGRESEGDSDWWGSLSGREYYLIHCLYLLGYD